MPQYKLFRFDVTKLNGTQRALLEMMVTSQAEASDYDGVLCDADGEEIPEDPNYPDVEVQEVCLYCHAVLVDGECGGEGEGPCTERACVEDYNPDGGTLDEVEGYVRWYCEYHGITNTVVPYRNDGLTYFDQLAYLVREYHGLEQPKRASRRLP